MNIKNIIKKALKESVLEMISLNEVQCPCFALNNNGSTEPLVCSNGQGTMIAVTGCCGSNNGNADAPMHPMCNGQTCTALDYHSDDCWTGDIVLPGEDNPIDREPLSSDNLSIKTKGGNPKPSIDNMMKEAAKNLIGENQLLLESYYCNTYNQNGVSSVQNSKCMQCAQQNGGHNCSCFGEDANGDVFEGTLQNDTGTYEGWHCGSVGGPTTNTPLDVDITNKTKNVINPTTNPKMPSTYIDRMMTEATENLFYEQEGQDDGDVINYRLTSTNKNGERGKTIKVNRNHKVIRNLDLTNATKVKQLTKGQDSSKEDRLNEGKLCCWLRGGCCKHEKNYPDPHTTWNPDDMAYTQWAGYLIEWNGCCNNSKKGACC